MVLLILFSFTNTRAVGDQPGGVLAIEIELKTAPGKEAQKVIGKPQSASADCAVGQSLLIIDCGTSQWQSPVRLKLCVSNNVI